MAAGGAASGDSGKLEIALEALRKSARRTKQYFIGSAAFYVVLITVFSVLVATVDEQGNRGILILVSLGFLGMWISALRGLRGTKITIAGLFNLARFPMFKELEELEDASRWSSEDERLKAAMELLKRQAEAEKEHRAWPNRALSLTVITIIDLLIWLVWENLVLALINQGIAMVVSQTHISLGPKYSLEAWEALEGGE